MIEKLDKPSLHDDKLLKNVQKLKIKEAKKDLKFKNNLI